MVKPMPSLDKLDIERFWSYVDRSTPDVCWTWKATRFTGGYGQFKAAGRTLRANRVAYFVFYHVDPLDKLVCHSCDNPACCNPHHLFLGNEKDNMQDAKSKGRLRPRTGDRHGLRMRPERAARGERVAGVKLTADQVREIRALYRSSSTQQQLADQFGVDRKSISFIVRGVNWRHIAEEDTEILISLPERQSKPGSKNPSAILNEDDVREIRKLHAEGVQGTEIAKRFNVSSGTIYNVVKRRNWKHLE
jgi:predicted DNA-binding protein (UPF0251 family)